MKTFHQTFSDTIDLTNGQVIIDEAKFEEIQYDALFGSNVLDKTKLLVNSLSKQELGDLFLHLKDHPAAKMKDWDITCFNALMQTASDFVTDKVEKSSILDSKNQAVTEELSTTETIEKLKS